ncbi:5-guanidino-2-oxopentanoate decarboxylase [Oceanibaculum pacificum]|uniref:Decarboxylase n=1 Tax=Oceanibaculum pacificum TaxID=580166 RepID=A0A154WGB0_9PROT|nr:5-guanidino-2-oxopentanoate decarboxylase [Oceanibaculum pacificum]KZD12561.1 hypothetical protein AUP43_15890 [Oceanibaculum pacificum]
MNSLSPTATSCGVAAIRLLEAYGVDLVFGIPGVHTLELYRGLGNSPIRHVTPRNEMGGGFMADGYARVTGKPGVCILTTGPGLTNAATPIGQAFSDSVPMLVITSVNARSELGMGRGRLHEITNQSNAIAPLVAFSQTILDPSELPEAMARAFAVFSGARPRPVHIEIPIDVLELPAAFPIRARLPLALPAPNRQAIADAAALLRTAGKPLTIVGGGALKAGAQVTALAEWLGGPVITTVAAKGVLRADHPLSLGSSMPSPATKQAIAEADLVLVVGSELSETDIWAENNLSFGGKLIRIDIDAASLTRDYHPDVAILSDAGAALDALLAELGAAPDRSARQARTAALRQEIETAIAQDRTAVKRKHVRLLEALRTALPEDGVVFTDMTQIAYTGNQAYPCFAPSTWHHPSGYGTLGFGMPAAIGAQLGKPETPVVALVGDGGLLFTVQELMTAVEEQLGLVILMWNNDGYGQIRDGLIQRGVPEIGVNLRNPDHMALARAFGCDAVQPDSLEALVEAVRAAPAKDRPTFIQVRQDAPFLD